MLPLNFFEEIFSFEGARPDKGLRIWPFSKKVNPKIFTFWIFSKNSFRNELYAPFLLYFDTQTPYVKFSFFCLWDGPKNSKYFKCYLKNISTRVSLKQKIKEIFVCPKSAVRGCSKLNFCQKIHRGIRNQELGKVKKCQVWVVWIFFEERAINRRGSL